MSTGRSARRFWGRCGRLGSLGLCLCLCLWTPGLSAAAASAAALTGAQRDWLAAHGPWRLGTERDHGPFVFAGPDGQMQGLSIDMLRLVQQRTGLRVNALPGQPLAQVLQAAERGEVDVMSSLRPTLERARSLIFTQPYVAVPAVVVMRRTRAPLGLPELVGQPVAVGQGYAVESVVRARHPGVLWQPVADDLAALRGVAEGRFAAAVVDAASLSFVVKQQGLTGLAATAEANFHYALSFAVRKDLPELRDILEAGFRVLTLAERQVVLDRWLLPSALAQAPAASPWATRLGWALLLGGALLGLALLGRWRRALAASAAARADAAAPPSGTG
jgi:ABC-type amino acid transport substrate-binding protein